MSYSTFAEYYNHQIIYNHRKVMNTEQFRLEPQTHDAFEMIYIKEGNLTYRIDEKAFTVKKDSLILTRPGRMHLMDFNTYTVYDRYDIIFDTRIVFDDVYKSLSDDVHVIDCNHLPVIFELFEKMDFYCNHYYSDALKNILSHLTDEIFYNITLAERTTEPLKYTVDPLFAGLIKYIDSHLSEPFTLEQVCKELFISKSNLHKIFKQHLNITPKRYIRSKRLNLAQKMLRKGFPATNVYESCGFSDYSVFYRSYKKEFGNAPSDEIARKSIRSVLY